MSWVITAIPLLCLHIVGSLIWEYYKIFQMWRSSNMQTQKWSSNDTQVIEMWERYIAILLSYSSNKWIQDLEKNVTRDRQCSASRNKYINHVKTLLHKCTQAMTTQFYKRNYMLTYVKYIDIQIYGPYNIGSEDLSSQRLPQVNPGRIGWNIQILQNARVAR